MTPGDNFYSSVKNIFPNADIWENDSVYVQELRYSTISIQHDYYDGWMMFYINPVSCENLSDCLANWLSKYWYLKKEIIDDILILADKKTDEISNGYIPEFYEPTDLLREKFSVSRWGLKIF